MKDIAIYGAGGFGREIACLIAEINRVNPTWNLIGFFDDGLNPGDTNEYGKILGNLETLNNWKSPISIGMAIGNPQTLKTLVSKITNPYVEYPNLIAPDTVFHDVNNYKIGKGNIICVRSCISVNVGLGDFNILNGYITLGHDSKLGSFNCLMTGARICGGVSINECNFLGVNSVVLQYKKLGSSITLGAGSVAMRNITKPGTYIGVPASKLTF